MPPRISNFLVAIGAIFLAYIVLNALVKYATKHDEKASITADDIKIIERDPTMDPDIQVSPSNDKKFTPGEGEDDNADADADDADADADADTFDQVKGTRNRKRKKERPTELAPCGEICSYGGTLVVNDTGFYPQWYKSINCKNVMKRMAYRDYPVIDPPPTDPPEELIDDFTMRGQVPLQYLYQKPKVFDRVIRFKQSEIDDNTAKVWKGEDVNSYAKGKCVQVLLGKHRDKIRDRRGVVIGSIGPWLESILLANGAKHLTTLEYAKVVSEDPRISTFIPHDYAEVYLNNGNFQKFDFAASFSSIEHSGLGRYYDPINPFGDLEAVAQVWCMVKPGGLFGLGVPWRGNKDVLVWNAHRAYGDKRLQHLTANWKVVERASCAGHHFIILRKPSK